MADSKDDGKDDGFDVSPVLHITTTRTSQQNKTVTHIQLKFKSQINDGIQQLFMQEDEGQ